jgi:hypothetical protein
MCCFSWRMRAALRLKRDERGRKEEARMTRASRKNLNGEIWGGIDVGRKESMDST